MQDGVGDSMHWKLLITERALTAEDFLPTGDRLMANDSRFQPGLCRLSSVIGLVSLTIPWFMGLLGSEMTRFIGFKSVIFNARVGNNVAIGIGSIITGRSSYR